MLQQQHAKVALDQCKHGSRFWYGYQTDYRERVEQLIAILEDPARPDGSKIRLADAPANSHLHRVLQNTVLRKLENKSEAKDVISALESAFRENRALPLTETIPIRLEQNDG
jgi:hypothetical protein